MRTYSSKSRSSVLTIRLQLRFHSNLSGFKYKLSSCHALAWLKYELYDKIMRVAYVICMKPLCCFLSPNTSAVYEVLYPQHDMNASMYYYFLPTGYGRDYIKIVFEGSTLTSLCFFIRYHRVSCHNSCGTLQPQR